MRTLYEKIISNLNEMEQNNCKYLLFINGDFINYNKKLEKNNLCLNVKIKDNRKIEFLNILNKMDIQYSISNDNQYFTIVELDNEKNYIVIDYVVDSHIMIPKSFLRVFGKKGKDGYEVSYIDYSTKQIKSKKIKEYGAIYGYYNKYIEDFLSNNYEDKIGRIRSDLYEFYKGNITPCDLPDKKFIMDFIDITICRNPKTLEEINKNSIMSRISGGVSHSYILEKFINGNFPNYFDDYEINIMLNKTDSDFIINDSMYSYVKLDDKTIIIVLPITPKICIVLMDKEYIKKYIKNGELYCIEIYDKKVVAKLNSAIYVNAVANKENVIGNYEELEKLKELI